jgi:hypothetical protein
MLLGRVKALILSKSGVGRELPCLALVSRGLKPASEDIEQMHLTRMARAYPWQEQEGKRRWRIKSTSGVCWFGVDIVSCFTIFRRGFAFQANGDALTCDGSELSFLVVMLTYDRMGPCTNVCSDGDFQCQLPNNCASGYFQQELSDV